MATSTIASMAPISHGLHETTLVSLAQDFAHRVSNRDQQVNSISTSLLKNKNLLVPTRLALKRQRAALKAPSMQYTPIRSDTLQMELGNIDEATAQQSDRGDDDLSPPLISKQTTSPGGEHPTHEENRIQSTSYRSSPLRGDTMTPHTLPTDISLLYREKPLFFHPVTGNFIVQYAEKDGTPSPCSYVLPRKSCREKNAPAYTFGPRCLVEKMGGSRTGWQKQWFAHSDPFTTKVDFGREKVWPSPVHYRAKPSIGIQTTKITFPSWSIGTRLRSSPLARRTNNPGPDTYDSAEAFRNMTGTNTYITLKSRMGGTQISSMNSSGKVPGPGAHNETKFLSNKHSAPKHSFGRRMPTSLSQDPYVNALPSLEIYP